MAQKANSHDSHQKSSKHRQGGLPVSIHPDDAKDKVFTAILKALLKMGNKPSSPKELANIIVKHKYATLGGATPFATVSSRISQHFKRAAEHNPPRAPLLAKHVDQNHSRKINYSLATGESSNNNNNTASTEAHDDYNTAATNATNDDDDDKTTISNTSTFIEDPNRTNSKIRRPPTLIITSSSVNKKHSRSRKAEEEVEQADDEEDEEDDSETDDEEDEEDYHKSKKLKSDHHDDELPPITTSPSIHPIQQQPRPSTIEGYTGSPTILHNGSDEEDSDGGHSDYHEEMLKGDDDLDIPLSAAARRFSRRQSAIIAAAHAANKKQQTNNINNKSINSINNNTNNTVSTTTTTSPNLSLSPHPHEPLSSSSTLLSTTTAETTVETSKDAASANNNNNTTATSTAATQKSSLLVPPNTTTVTTGIRKPSFSFSSGFPGDQELWTPFSFEHDFDNVFLQEASTAHHIPFNIATPESVSVSELDNYFSSTSSSSTRSQRKSFSSAMLGPNDKSLLQKVLLASAARGVADKIDEEDEEQEADPPKEKKLKEKEKPVIAVKEEEEKPPAPIKSTFSSSSLMDVDNGEDFVKFEDDEKKESPALPTRTPPPAVAVAATPQPPVAAPSPAPQPAPAVKKVADILPATSTPTLSAAEILKSMNIQNLNLSALHQMTSNIPSLQHLSPTFDLAKTMAAYMQSLAKSANANASSSSNSPHAMDLKSILTRFPALEAFIKKDPVVATPPTPAPPPLVSPNPDFVPNLINGAPTEPIVHTLTTMTPPMYITLIDHIAVCIVVLAKTEHTPEYRIMRRVDTGFINGTVLLTAGGIETESERSMILSFEMERVRMPKKKSQLFGTWIPLRRAQELAVTCSIQHKLGHFLEDSIESYFPNPLPIQVNTRKPHRDSRLTALALAALRSDNVKTNGFIVPPISRQSSSSGSMGAAQLQELLLTHPHKALKSNGLNKAPLLGRYDDNDTVTTTEPQQLKQVPSKSAGSSVANSTNSSISGKDDSDVDIVNSSDSSVAATSSNEEDSESEADNNNNTNTVKNDNNKKPLDLEEIISRVTNSTNKQPLHIHPRDLQKKRRRSSIMKEEEESEPKVPKISQTIVRKKSTSSTGGGKWSSSSSSNSNSSGGKSTNVKKPSTIIIKKSVTGNTSGGGKKNHVVKKEEEDEIDNVVVEHKPTVETKVESPKPAEDELVEEEENIDEDDEDEDIDIGGSDFDDDLR